MCGLPAPGGYDHSMLRLRRHIERAAERRWLRLLIVLAIAVLLVFTIGHMTRDALDHHEAMALACIAITFMIVFSPLRRPAGAIARRSRPTGYATAGVRPSLPPPALPLFVPLRR